MENQNLESVISPNPFDSLSETDLIYLLQHNSEQLTEAQKLDIQARISKFERVRQAEMEVIDFPEPAKQFKKLPQNNRRAGYVDIIILMLTVWATCLCGMAYVYSQLNILG